MASSGLMIMGKNTSTEFPSTDKDISRATRGSQLGLRGLLVVGALALAGQAVPATASSLGVVATPQDQRTAEAERYVLVGASGARALGLPDSKGHSVLDIPRDTPLAVYSFRAGNPYLKVTVPGGVKVWVYGKYLQESSRPGWVEVSANFVNMRPMANSTRDSYPLGRLNKGDRLRFVQRANPDKPMGEDWVQVFSPQDAKVYVLAAETRSLPAGANAEALWAAAEASALRASPAVAVPSAGGASGGSQAQEAKAPATASTAPKVPTSSSAMFADLAAANRLMDEAIAKESKPDFVKLTGLYNSLLQQAPDAPTQRLIQVRLERLAAYQEFLQLREDVVASGRDRDKELAMSREDAKQGQRNSDPLWGRFQSRGWLERQVRDGKTVYLVSWGPDILAQVQCSSGRYQLDLYAGFEIGIKGVAVRAAKATPGGYPLYDIDRIEVISSRLTKR
jgi:hypothetical protein